MELSTEQVRVLGVLMEKAATTPEQYPMTTNAVVTACNQKSSRDPVVDFSERIVTDAIYALRNDHKLARSLTGGSRTVKHRHVVDETLGLDPHQCAVLAVLALRGAQTPGELRTRTERYVGFEELDEVEDILRTLAERPDPLVVDLGRRPGQSQHRWTHLLSGEPVDNEPSAPAPRSTGTRSPTAVADLTERLERLEQRVAILEAALAAPSEDGDAG